MSKITKIVAAAMATMVMSSAFVGCGKDKGNDEKTIKISSQLMTAEVDELRTIAEAWGKDNGYTVKVEEDQSEVGDTITALQSDDGADIEFGIAHDRLGQCVKAGVVAEMKDDTFDQDSLTSDVLLDAVTVDGTLYAAPIAQETTALFYNKSKVSEVPDSMEKIVDSGLGFEYQPNNFYYSYAFLSANGGYVYKNNKGKIDVKDIGLNNDGAVKGLEFIASICGDGKMMPSDIQATDAKEHFKNGDCAYYLSGAWDISDLKEALGDDLGATVIPSLGGGTPSPFMTVQSAFVNENSDKQDAAFKLLKYLIENTKDMLIETGNRLPVYSDATENKTFKDDEILNVFVDQCKVGTPMPNVPEASNMWTPAQNGIDSVAKGESTPQEAADKIVEDIKEANNQ